MFLFRYTNPLGFTYYIVFRLAEGGLMYFTVADMEGGGLKPSSENQVFLFYDWIISTKI